MLFEERNQGVYIFTLTRPSASPQKHAAPLRMQTINILEQL